MAKQKNVKRQLIINVTLMLFTLLTLVACVTAWFSNRAEANINNLNLMVSRRELVIEVLDEHIIFPYATKLFDTDATIFDTETAQPKIYNVNGGGKVYIEVTCEGPGMLAYVPESATVTNYHSAIIEDLREHFQLSANANYQQELAKKSFEDISDALFAINKQRMLTFENEATQMKIVYWVEYDEAKVNLNKPDYWLDTNNYTAYIKISG